MPGLARWSRATPETLSAALPVTAWLPAGGDPLAARLGRRLGLLAGALALVHLVGPVVGLSWGLGVSVTLVATGLCLELFPERALAVAALGGLAVLGQWAPLRFVAYEVLVVGVAYLVRERAALLAGWLVTAVVVLPKELFRTHYHEPFLHDWINAFMLAQVALACAYWWVERRRGRARDPGLGAWFALFLFPTQAMNPIAFAPCHLWQPRTAGARSVASAALVLAAKAAAIAALRALAPTGRFPAHTAESLAALSVPGLWAVTVQSYLWCALTLSASADLVVLIGRALGWPLPHPFRWALLAWNPCELWRRWSIYNRRLLLTLVYFPLGGSRRRRALNVMAVFLASGLVLHSGWLGSKYWSWGFGGWRDQTAYFLLQGAGVLACLACWRLAGKPSDGGTLRLSWSRVLCTAGTQALSAWMHVLVLAPNLPWSRRWAVMAALLGW